ncbi:hypothetical protein [Jannaschia sp. 2305UL9-9]|uniref:hypothetical protein n=1 Tax=Jannaschia sp. 2305UL9-9 TaxID=3121638 RepID=UPI003529BF0A
MSDASETAADQAQRPMGPAAKRRAQRAAAKAPQSITGKLAARFRRPDVRRRMAMITLLAMGSVVAWNLFGQNGPTDVARGLSEVTDAAMASRGPDTQMAGVAAMVATGTPTPGTDAETVLSAPQEPIAVAALETPSIRTLTDVRETQATTGEGPCAVSVQAMPLAAATIALEIASPCDAGARVDIIQDDLQVAIALDDAGLATVEVPSLSDTPSVAVLVEARDPVVIQSETVDFDRYHRAVLFWQDDAGLELHAFEGDATYGEEGHVGPSGDRTIAHALSGNGGFLTTVGDPTLDESRAAMIYTVPAGMSVDLSIEAAVTETNCEKTVYGGTIQTGPGIAAITQDVTLTMPTCEAVGDYILLGSLLRPIAVASN